MKEYFKHLNKIEFAVTDACTGKCKHCSQGNHSASGIKIDPKLCAKMVRQIAKEFSIETAMVFGGEPLLHMEAVSSIMHAAMEMQIPKRQLITNGFVSQDRERISAIAKMLLECGVNDLLLSVDAFHQETIPLLQVKAFALETKSFGIPIRLQPAWVSGSEKENPYNRKTKEILASFEDLAIPVSEGNIIFPEGNAAKFLAEYFKTEIPENPYLEDPFDVRCLSVAPDGAVLGGNLYESDILDLIENYKP